MSVTVRTPGILGAAVEHVHADAELFRIEDEGFLRLLTEDRKVVAVYAPGNWLSVADTADAAEQEFGEDGAPVTTEPVDADDEYADDEWDLSDVATCDLVAELARRDLP